MGVGSFASLRFMRAARRRALKRTTQTRRFEGPQTRRAPLKRPASFFHTTSPLRFQEGAFTFAESSPLSRSEQRPFRETRSQSRAAAAVTRRRAHTRGTIARWTHLSVMLIDEQQLP